MELPREILIGDNVISNLGEFVRSINNDISNVVIICGQTVKNRTENIIHKTLHKANLNDYWYVRNEASIATVSKSKSEIEELEPGIILGLGGGKSVDVGKMIAFYLKKPFISIPTSASHDGIASPFVSLRGTDKPHSIKAITPIGVLADTKLISEAPLRLLSSGCGDLIGKMTAVKDWELARDENNEYFGSYSASLAQMSASIILDRSTDLLTDKKLGLRTIIEALISSGVAACIAGSSRPCSGSEHLFSHAVEYIVGDSCGLHGERVGIGTILMAKLHGLQYEKIIQALTNLGAPTKASQLNIRENEVIQALLIAQSLRPERYTILSKTRLNKTSAYELAKSVRVI